LLGKREETIALAAEEAQTPHGRAAREPLDPGASANIPHFGVSLVVAEREIISARVESEVGQGCQSPDAARARGYPLSAKRRAPPGFSAP
jgi:hypothetical protein